MIALLLLLADPQPSGVFADAGHNIAFTVVKVKQAYVTEWSRWDGKEHTVWTYGVMVRTGPMTYRESYYYPDPAAKGTGELTYNPLTRTFSGYGFEMQRLP